MSHDVSEQIQSVELDWFAESESVDVTPRDQQRFQIQKDRAIAVLQVAHREEQFQKQFSLLLNIIGTWLCNRHEQVRDAFLTLQDDSLALIIVRNTSPNDAAFEDELSELDYSIANDADLDLVRLNTLTLPPVSRGALMSFLDKRLILLFPFSNGK